MKAIIYHRYGSADVLQLAEVERPVARAGEVLIRVRAAAANPLDYHIMKGILPVRPMIGVFRPRAGRLGVDLAGVVEAVGASAAGFSPGDEVFGTGEGAFAEYACAPVTRLARKPPGLSFEQGASIGVAGLTALQGLRDKARLGPGQKVLINGAGGGVGTFAIQIARSLGAHVTGVCGTGKVDLVKSLGADQVVDYTRDDPTRSAERYDVLFDCAGGHSLFEFVRVMRPRGRFLAVGGQPGGRWLGPLPGMFKTMAQAPFVRPRVILYVASGNTRDLTTLAEMIERGQVKPVIGRRYPLDQAAQAMAYLMEGHAAGKVVIRIA